MRKNQINFKLDELKIEFRVCQYNCFRQEENKRQIVEAERRAIEEELLKQQQEEQARQEFQR